MTAWRDDVDADLLAWLLEESDPGPRHLALRDLVGLPADDPPLIAARTAAMSADPIAAFLAEQDPEGWWAAPGVGYGPKYAGTAWSLTFLAQMGADGKDERIHRACEYALAWSQAENGGFSVSGSPGGRAVPSGALHCINGNLLRTMLDFGYVEDPRVRRSIDWEIARITGEGVSRWYSTTPGPGFRCGPNDGNPCAWGAIKALLALARIPAELRPAGTDRAIETTAEFLLSRDPAVADYPHASFSSPVNGSWFKLAFPIGYVTDVLQNVEALCAAGYGADPRLDHAFEWLLAQRDDRGRWRNTYSYHGKMAADVDRQGQPSKWVTIRACRALKARTEARAEALAAAR